MVRVDEHSGHGFSDIIIDDDFRKNKITYNIELKGMKVYR